jgi:hypothetical protein
MTDEKKPAALPRGVKKTARGWEIALDFPIEHDGQKIETAMLRRPSVGDVEIMARESGDDEDASAGLVAMNNLMARLIGVSDDAMRTVDAEDWARMLEVIRPHLEKLQRGGLI